MIRERHGDRSQQKREQHGEDAAVVEDADRLQPWWDDNGPTTAWWQIPGSRARRRQHEAPSGEAKENRLYVRNGLRTASNSSSYLKTSDLEETFTPLAGTWQDVEQDVLRMMLRREVGEEEGGREGRWVAWILALKSFCAVRQRSSVNGKPSVGCHRDHHRHKTRTLQWHNEPTRRTQSAYRIRHRANDKTHRWSQSGTCSFAKQHDTN